ncbi:MAG: hypothetical protein COB22_03135 [Cycloclasticus sp.]|nr:MAG: hypothetical protein COB22_03135 [Cycloclasticus sp.]
MNALIIAALWPEPTSSAVGRRMVHLLELFCAQGWSLTYACTALISGHWYPLASLDIKHHSMRNTKFMSLWLEEKNKGET